MLGCEMIDSESVDADHTYEKLADDRFYMCPNYMTAVESCVQPVTNAAPATLPAPESSQNGGNQKSQKPSGQEITDLRSNEYKAKVKKSTKVVKRSRTQDEINPVLNLDVENKEEMGRQNLRYQKLFQEIQKKAFRTKVCIWVTTFILIFFGIALTTFLLFDFFY